MKAEDSGRLRPISSSFLTAKIRTIQFSDVKASSARCQKAGSAMFVGTHPDPCAKLTDDIEIDRVVGNDLLSNPVDGLTASEQLSEAESHGNHTQ